MLGIVHVALIATFYVPLVMSVQPLNSTPHTPFCPSYFTVITTQFRTLDSGYSVVRATRVYCNYLIKEESRCMHHNIDSCCFFFCPIRLIHVVGCAFLKLQSCWQAATLPFVSHRTQGLVQKNCLIHYVQYMAHYVQYMAHYVQYMASGW